MIALMVAVLMALLVGWLAGMLTSKRAARWCPVDGSQLACLQCTYHPSPGTWPVNQSPERKANR